MIELRNVSRMFGEVRGLDELTITFPDRITSVVIGPSGSGKSTILRLVMGLIRPDSGSVLFQGREIRPENAEAFRRRMGYVIQEGGLFPHLTAGGNAALMARYLGWREERITERLSGLAEMTRFPPEAFARYPSQLSGGQRQRVCLMRALMLDPDVLLLDEPLGALDPLIRSELQADLRNIFQALKKTVVLVTHDLGEAAFFGDDIILMREGRIVQRGALPQLLRAPADPFVTLFINAQRNPPALLGTGYAGKESG